MNSPMITKKPQDTSSPTFKPMDSQIMNSYDKYGGLLK
ncbi:hypothetical protein AO385_1389 [Moraxella catarrhalis]|uniref:Uncharacterized protein n=1 Tax=Moraxella catarrhalis TaxID=480 RepID=A0A198UED5_MORCA|nr:hypothetical protein AO383_2145 [Moraxella catarrhalis]OAU94793.1 hypothetical protein AO384_2150 [Moraxella catarrhalis]OAU99606.1 hypothetical protein AO385_1389 [Moraxella catarrhalis]